MKKILYIIPVRLNNEVERYHSLCYVLKNIHWFFRNISSYQFHIGIIEQDISPKINNFLVQEYPQCLYEFVYNDGLFNRAWAFNVMLKKYPDFDIYTFADGDILLSLQDYQYFFSFFQYKATQFVLRPRNVADLHQEATQRLYAMNDYFSDKYITETDVQMNRSPLISAGGICAATKESINSVGWWDEEFEGWGGEDNALLATIKHFNKNYILPKGTLYHLYHPKYHRSNNSTYLKNLQRTTEYNNRIHKVLNIHLEHKGNPLRYTKPK